MKHNFENDKPHIFNRYYKEEIKEKFDEFIEIIKGEIENWSEMGSGWEVERMTIAYVNVAPIAGRNLFTSSSQSGKKDNQRMPKMGSKSCFNSSKRWKEPAKTKQISG